jgi:arylsulfatase A-like enzyme
MRAVVLTVSGLQPAYLGAYGNEWAPTPTVDAWAAAGVVFDNHFSNDPDPSAARRAWWDYSDTTGSSNLLQDLRAAGVRTVRIGPARSSAEPSDAAWDVRATVAREAGPITLKPTRRAIRQALEQLADAPSALVWVEIDALHPPWTVPEELVAEFFPEDDDDGETEQNGATPTEPWTGGVPERIDAADDARFRCVQRTYAAAVTSLDDALGRLWKDCAKNGWADEAFWLLTSDAGFPLGEHGAVGPARAGLHEELIHLPLVMRWPGGEHAGLRVRELTQPPDVAATLRELYGLPTVDSGGTRAGHSLLPLARDAGGPVRSHAVCIGEREGVRSWGVRTLDGYLLATDGPESVRRLYVKPDDRWEFNDVAKHHPDTVAQLEQLYREATKD